MASGGLKWRSRPRDLIQHEFDGDNAVVFDRGTGETHFLNPLTLLVLKNLTADGRSLEQLVDVLDDWGAESIDSDSVAKIQAALWALELAELVEFEAGKPR